MFEIAQSHHAPQRDVTTDPEFGENLCALCVGLPTKPQTISGEALGARRTQRTQPHTFTNALPHEAPRSAIEAQD